MNLEPFQLPTAQGVVTYPAGATFGPRQMRDYEFVWLVEGDARYTRDGREYVAPQGSVVLCQPDTLDAFVWDVSRRTTHGFFHFRLNGQPDFLPPSSRWATVRTPGTSDVLTPLLLHLLHLIAGSVKTPEGEIQTRLALATALTVFVNGDAETQYSSPAQFPEPVERAWEFIRQTLTQTPEIPLTLPEIAAAACVTEAHLCRLFRSAVGVSPMNAVRQVRLDRAITLLTRSNYTVGEVAILCGFLDPLHFSELFKKTFGYPPTELRRRVADGMTPPTPALFSSGKLTRT